ncbi:hypothetical protein [Paracoccus denitrificans]|uniref:hypothetical protein n=1 Tax=Paracoccus denitrificans TaxID=266 RepID=UPI000CEBEB7F|nr:hypothetical protein [Paracoccus denitrificans]UFS65576.1 hypothetical protein LO749_03155 [Paracoccus denitrificans]
MMIFGNVLAVELEDDLEAHVRRYLAFRFAGHAVMELRSHNEIWTARLGSAESGDVEVKVRANLIEDDLCLAFDILELSA